MLCEALYIPEEELTVRTGRIENKPHNIWFLGLYWSVFQQGRKELSSFSLLSLESLPLPLHIPATQYCFP
jgi:hypothetical protein